MRRKIAWPGLASFGGITRIRFKGSPIPPSRNRTLSQAAPPHLILGQNKTETTEVNKSGPRVWRARESRRIRRGQYAIDSIRRPRRLLRTRFGCLCLLHVRVKDRLPFSLLFLPDRGGVVVTGLVFPIVCAFDSHLVCRDDFLEVVGLFVLKGLPGRFLFRHHCVLVRRRGD